VIARCKENEDDNRPIGAESQTANSDNNRKVSEIESTPDGIASALTRRFGLAGGLAWLGFLSFGVVSEQVKTRQEVRAINEGAVEVDAGEVTLASGLSYKDLRLGGGDAGCGILGRTSGEKGCGEPRRGDLVTVSFDGTLQDGTKFADSRRDVSFVFGRRPNEAEGISSGLLEAISTMTQGGIREISVPPSAGFGDVEVETNSGVKIPAGSTLKYRVSLKKVSVAPS